MCCCIKVSLFSLLSDFVLILFVDLLSSTPISSPARAVVERALEGATRLAQRCNRAQDNAAFLM